MSQTSVETSSDVPPSLSVLMAVKDGEAFLTSAIESLLSQTYRNFELIVVDDGSTDATAEILTTYAIQDSRICIIRNEYNIGLAASLNRGLENCRAALVARADADDLYAPDRFERQLAFLDAHQSVGLLGCGFHRIQVNGDLISTVRPPQDHETIWARQVFMNSFLHPGVVFRAEVVRAAGGYDTYYSTAEDSDLWVRLRDRTRFANLLDPLVNYRIHPSSLMGSRSDHGRRLSLSVPQRLLSALLDRPLDDADTSAVVTLYQGFEAMSSTDVRRAIPILREVLRRLATKTPSHAMTFLRKEAAASCLKQMQRHIWSDRPLARSLLLAAFALDPRTALKRQALRTLLPHRGS